MKIEKLTKLIEEMSTVIQENELQETDSRALDLLLRAQEVKQATMCNQEMEEYIETVRVANLHALSA